MPLHIRYQVPQVCAQRAFCTVRKTGRAQLACVMSPSANDQLGWCASRRWFSATTVRTTSRPRYLRATALLGRTCACVRQRRTPRQCGSVPEPRALAPKLLQQRRLPGHRAAGRVYHRVDLVQDGHLHAPGRAWLRCRAQGRGRGAQLCLELAPARLGAPAGWCAARRRCWAGGCPGRSRRHSLPTSLPHTPTQTLPGCWSPPRWWTPPRQGPDRSETGHARPFAHRGCLHAQCAGCVRRFLPQAQGADGHTQREAAHGAHHGDVLQPCISRCRPIVSAGGVLQMTIDYFAGTSLCACSICATVLKLNKRCLINLVTELGDRCLSACNARAQLLRNAMSMLSCAPRCSAIRTETGPLRQLAELPPPGAPGQARSWGCQASASWRPEWRLPSAAVHSAAMADAVESIRQERGEGVASSQALADDAVIWASQHGLVPPVA